jgi:hypothetical protein
VGRATTSRVLVRSFTYSRPRTRATRPPRSPNGRVASTS